MNILRRFFPPSDWLRTYDRSRLRGDISAGVTVGVLLIPQGMAYALIAGLPPVYGLYASFVPLLVYALFGTSRELAVGPVAMVSLLVAAGVQEIAVAGTERYIELAILLALISGLIQLLMGLARMGFLVNFLSHPVIAGFTSAAAIIIGLSQLKHILGVELPSTYGIHEITIAVVSSAGDIHLPTVVLGVFTILLLVGLKRWRSTFPAALVAVALGTAAVWLFEWHDIGVAIVGPVPEGLPSPVFPDLNFGDVRALLPMAAAIALVGFTESIAIAKSFATKRRYDVDANQELIALGLASAIGSIFRSYPVTGGFSRTAVNATAGAASGMASLISAGIIGVTLLFITSLFYYLPNAVLGAVIIVAVAGLVDWREARFLLRVNRQDFALMMVTFAATLFVGIEEGILVGVLASIGTVIYLGSRPNFAVLGRIPGTTIYRNVRIRTEGVEEEGILVVRMDASMYFTNIMEFKSRLMGLVRKREPLHAVVLDAYPMNDVDSSAIHALREIAIILKEQQIDFYVAGAKKEIRDKLERAELVKLFANRMFFTDVHEAVVEAMKTSPSPAESSPS